jgi:predicted acetyltransferase
MHDKSESIALGTENTDKPFVDIELVLAGREQEPILANLLELYIHDFSEFHNCEVGDDGRFGYRFLPLYWSEPYRHAFLIRTSGKLAGLVFVTGGPGATDNDSVWDMAEFFVLRGYRRRRIGTTVAHEVWRLLPGRWEVRVMHSNVSAQQFWARTISAFIGEAAIPICVERGSAWWQIFSFETKRLA